MFVKIALYEMYSYHVNTDFTNLAYPQGFEPRPTVLETVMLPLTPGIYFYSIEIKSPIIWTAMSTNIDAILNATNSICFLLLCVVLVETDGFEPPRFLGARFTVWCNQPLCHVSVVCNTLPLCFLTASGAERECVY